MALGRVNPPAPTSPDASRLSRCCRLHPLGILAGPDGADALPNRLPRWQHSAGPLEEEREAVAMKNLLRYVLRGRADRQYQERGFYVFRQALPFGEVQTLADLARDLISYPGKILRQNGELAANEFFPGSQIVRNSVLNAHLPISEAMKPIYAALGAIITSPALAARLRELDGAGHYTIHQTLLFFAAQTTGLHLDSWALDTAPRGFAHTLWIPASGHDLQVRLALRHPMAPRQGRDGGGTRMDGWWASRRTL